MSRALAGLLLLLSGCGASPEQLVSGVGGVGVASVAIIHRSPFDAVYSALTGRDCSVVRLDENKSYCRGKEPPPERPPYCTRSLGVVDCWTDAARPANGAGGVADGPETLTPAQDADRTRRWPF
ncbi:MAG TPA: hypothetical protein VN702_18025 [Acetobacteraceae bacterium]|nr:hypothetical protein [Acetobacteraceae bacterium]